MGEHLAAADVFRLAPTEGPAQDRRLSPVPAEDVVPDPAFAVGSRGVELEPDPEEAHAVIPVIEEEQLPAVPGKPG